MSRIEKICIFVAEQKNNMRIKWKWFTGVYLVIIAMMAVATKLLPEYNGRIKLLFTIITIVLPLIAFALNINYESKRDMNDAENKLDKNAISRIEDILTNLKREKISLKFVSSPVEPLPIGASKYGGQPDVPDGLEWPIDKDGRPLSLLLQINCTDIAALDKKNLLPKSGILYFFYQVSEQPWDNTTNGAHVLYFDVPIADLHKKDYPDNLTQEETITERALQFKVENSYPSFDDLLRLSQDTQYLIDHWDEYTTAFERLADDYLNDEAGIGFLLGYAELIQSSIVDNLENNVLLLQLDSDEENDDGVIFGDCGSIYYYIPKQDLIDRRFDQPTFELQCY